MKEYLGNKSKVYQQTRGKRFVLIPAIRRHLKNVPKGGTMLDVGCGIGDFYELAKQRNLKYFGFDKSPAMISRAKSEYPKGQYIVASATDFSSNYKIKFDVIVCSVVLPVLSSINAITKVLIECKKVLKPGGKIILGEPYPAFDGYMQSFLFKRKNIQTKFTGYFAAGAAVKVSHRLQKGTITFNDHHWTLHTYIKAMKDAGLRLVDIDECPPDREALKVDKSFYKERSTFPTYLLLEFSK